MTAYYVIRWDSEPASWVRVVVLTCSTARVDKHVKIYRDRFCCQVLDLCTVDSRYKTLRYKILCPIRDFSWGSHIMVSATKSSSYKIPHQVFHTNGIRYYQNLGSQRVSSRVSLLYTLHKSSKPLKINQARFHPMGPLLFNVTLPYYGNMQQVQDQ